MRLFSIAEVCTITGLNAQSLRNWVTMGLLAPAAPGTTGKGQGHRFSLVQVLAVAAGARYRAEGASGDRMAGVVNFLSTRQLEWLEAEMKAGRTFPVPSMMVAEAGGGPHRIPAAWVPGMMIEPPKPESPQVASLMKRLDLVAIYEDVKAKAAKLTAKPAKSTRKRRVSK